MNGLSEQEIFEVEREVKECSEKLELYEALERLKLNPDFKKLFLDEYCNKYLFNLLDLKVRAKDPNEIKFRESEIDSIGHFRIFMDLTVTEGKLAADKRSNDLAYLNESLKEE